MPSGLFTCPSRDSMGQEEQEQERDEVNECSLGAGSAGRQHCTACAHSRRFPAAWPSISSSLPTNYRKKVKPRAFYALSSAALLPLLLSPVACVRRRSRTSTSASCCRCSGSTCRKSWWTWPLTGCPPRCPRSTCATPWPPASPAGSSTRRVSEAFSALLCGDQRELWVAIELTCTPVRAGKKHSWAYLRRLTFCRKPVFL